MVPVGSRVAAVRRRLRRVERRGLRDLHAWLEETSHLLLLSVLILVPLLMGALTYLSNALDVLPFLLFPPLASGAYTLFSSPGSPAASPRRFVGGLTIGAASGWVALEVTARYWYHVTPTAFDVHPGAAAAGVLLTGVLTRALDLEEAQAYSTALLVLVSGAAEPVYVASVLVSSVVVAGAYLVWRDQVYDRRAELLYGTLQTDDHILVPWRGDSEAAERVASLAAQLAGAHDAGKVVLLEVVADGDASDEETADAEAAREASDRLEAVADRLAERYGVPCETVVAAAARDDAQAVRQLAEETGCDLVVVPYDVAGDGGRLSGFVQALFAGPLDVVAFRPSGDRTAWRRILVPVRRDGEVAHAMLDFAHRLAGDEGSVTVCHCLDEASGRHRAERMLATLVEPFDRAFETRVTRTPVAEFLGENAPHYDLTLVGASTDRIAASRVVSPPTFRRLEDLESDVAVVHVR